MVQLKQMLGKPEGDERGDTPFSIALPLRLCPAPFVGGGTMDQEEVARRCRQVDAACLEFISSALEGAITNGDTDVEIVEDAPEIQRAERSYRKEDTANALLLRVIT